VEWLSDQWTILERYRQRREPTPALPSSSEKDDSHDPLDLLNAYSASVTEPSLYKQSQQCPDSELWQEACKEEIEAHRQNGI
jgi:hypothetical protein